MKLKINRLLIIILIIGIAIFVIRFALIKINEKLSESITEPITNNVWAFVPGEWDTVSICKSGLTAVSKYSEESIAEGHIIGINGNILYSVNISNNESGELDTDIRTLSNGLHFIKKAGKETFLYAGSIEVDGDLFDPDFSYWSIDDNENLSRSGSHFNYGYINQQGIWIFEPSYGAATEFWNNHAVVQDAKVGADGLSNSYIIDLNGERKQIQKKGLQFDSQIYDGMLRMYDRFTADNNPNYYFLDVENNVLINEKPFEDAKDFSGGLAAISENGLWGYIDTSGEYVIEPQYLEAHDFSEGLACITDENGDTYFINQKSERMSGIIGKGYWAGEHHNGLFVWQDTDYSYGIYDMDFKRVHPKGEFAYVGYTDGVWIIGKSENDANVYIQECDKYIEGSQVPISGSPAPLVYPKVVVLFHRGKYSMYDRASGEQICSYEYIGEFSEGLAFVSEGPRGGFINISGELVIEMQLINSQMFSNTLAGATLQNGKTGMLVNPLVYPAWSSDENERASMLGLTVTEAESKLTYDELWRRIEELSSLIYNKKVLFGTEYPEKYDISIAELRRSLEIAEFPSAGVVDRQHLAVILTALSSAYGKATESYVEFYEDGDLIDPKCHSSVAYISSLCLFELDDSCVHPEKPVMCSEISIYLLRFFERTL